MNLIQKPNESVVSFIDRWKSLTSRATFMIPEGDAVCIAFSNIRGGTFSAIALGDCRTLLDLDERAVCMERKIGDRTITQYKKHPPKSSSKRVFPTPCPTF